MRGYSPNRHGSTRKSPRRRAPGTTACPKIRDGLLDCASPPPGGCRSDSRRALPPRAPPRHTFLSQSRFASENRKSPETSSGDDCLSKKSEADFWTARRRRPAAVDRIRGGPCPLELPCGTRFFPEGALLLKTESPRRRAPGTGFLRLLQLTRARDTSR